MSITTAFDGQLREALRANTLLELVQYVDDPAPHADSPPADEPDACLIYNYDGEQFEVLGHTGRYLHGMLVHGGYSWDELGLVGIPEKSGYYAMRAGHASGGTGGGDDYWYEMSGDWTPATVEDFHHFKVDVPAFAQELLDIIADLYVEIARLRGLKLVSPPQSTDMESMNFGARGRHD